MTAEGAGLRDGALVRIREALAERAVDALWVEASVDLRYLTGLKLLALERPCGLLVPASGEPRMLVPLLLHPETAGLPVEQLVWADHEGHEQALEAGNVVTVEPSIAVEGRFGLRYENVVHLGPEAPEVLNGAARRHSLREGS